MGDSTYGLAPLNLLVVFLVFGLMLLLPWSELWRKLAVGMCWQKGRGRSSRRRGHTVRYAEWSRGLIDMRGVRRFCRDHGGRDGAFEAARRPG